MPAIAPGENLPTVLYPGDVLFVARPAEAPPRQTAPASTAPWAPYVVRQGDYLAKLAVQFRFDADEVWHHPLNIVIANLRDPNLLYPGGILSIPQRPVVGAMISAGTTNVYAANLPMTPITLCFLHGGIPRANAPVTYLGLPPNAKRPSFTDGEGRLSLDVPIMLPAFEVFFDDEPDIVYSILVGHLDPIEEVPGVVERLLGLGYSPYDADDPTRLPDEDFESSPRFAAALIQAYNNAHDLEDEPFPTDVLVDKLRAEFGA